MKDAHRERAARFRALLDAGWDMVIIDEAHHVAGSSEDVARHQLAVELTGVAPNVLLLSATPHSIDYVQVGPWRTRVLRAGPAAVFALNAVSWALQWDKYPFILLNLAFSTHEHITMDASGNVTASFDNNDFECTP